VQLAQEINVDVIVWQLHPVPSAWEQRRGMFCSCNRTWISSDFWGVWWHSAGHFV